jgi:hypothetical protein
MNITELSYSQKVSLSPKFKKSKVSFGAGWSAQIEKEIEKSNVPHITDTFKKQGIDADFKDNKVVAWCSLKTLEIFNELNKKYKLNLGLPKAVYVEDFTKLKEQNPLEYGICNWYPAYLKDGSEKVYPERTVVFNSFEAVLKNSSVAKEYNWNNIDPITEDLYKKGRGSSSHFLSVFLHEFCHSSHNGNFIKKYTPENMLEKLYQMTNIVYLNKFQEKFTEDLFSISIKATENPLEAMADDMTQKITSVLDYSKLSLKKNPFKNSFYDSKDFSQLSTKESLMNFIWEGEELNFDI